MADRRTLDSAARAVHDKLEAAKAEYEQAVDDLDLAQARVNLLREIVANLLALHEMVKPKVRVRTKAAKPVKVPA